MSAAASPPPLSPRPDVALAPLRPEHAAATYRWVCDPEVSRNLGLRRTPSLAATGEWIAAAAADTAVQAFAVTLAGRHVGNVVLDQLDAHLGSARLSIYIGESDARGGGVGRAATALALRSAFADLGLHKVWLNVHARNLPAIGAYAAAGFALEGVLRDEFLLDGERLPALRMAVLRSDWEAGGARGPRGHRGEGREG